MPEYGDWTITLNIAGKVKTVRSPLKLQVEKGYTPFWTEVIFENAPNGVLIQVGVKAHDETSADDAALFFVGQALDVLALRLNMPLYLSLANVEARKLDLHAKRSVSKDEWGDAFRLGREYGIERPIFSRGLSWYRKGLNSEDPIDAFLAFWAAIHGISAKFAERTVRTRRGAVNQICNCLDQLWGDQLNWKIIPDNPRAINQFQEIRNRISHGGISVDVENIKMVSAEVHKIKELVRAFLADWELHKHGPEPRDIVEAETEFAD